MISSGFWRCFWCLLRVGRQQVNAADLYSSHLNGGLYEVAPVLSRKVLIGALPHQ
jgi:hypothetical protein